MSDFKTVVTLLERADIACQVKEVEGREGGNRILIELGFHYPDEMVDQVKNAIGDLKAEILASSSGHTVLSSVNVNGGPNSYSFIGTLLGGW
jgi:hypothetical protein